MRWLQVNQEVIKTIKKSNISTLNSVEEIKLTKILLEINPWAVDPNNKLYCIDGKLNVDDNAKFRQKDIMKMRESNLGSEEVDFHEQLVNLFYFI